MPPIKFSRSGRTGPFGKLTAEIPKIRVPDDFCDAGSGSMPARPCAHWLYWRRFR